MMLLMRIKIRKRDKMECGNEKYRKKKFKKIIKDIEDS